MPPKPVMRPWDGFPRGGGTVACRSSDSALSCPPFARTQENQLDGKVDHELPTPGVALREGRAGAAHERRDARVPPRQAPQRLRDEPEQAVDGTPSSQTRRWRRSSRQSKGGVFNNAAQHWNHSFFWNCLSPDGGGEPERRAGARRSTRDFGASTSLQGEVHAPAAATQFGSRLGLAGRRRAASSTSMSTRQRRPAADARRRRRCSPSTCGSTPTTSTTATRARSTSRPSGRARELGLRGEELQRREVATAVG